MRVPTKIICAGDGPLTERWQQVLDQIPVPYEFAVINGADHGFNEEGKEDELFGQTLAYLKFVSV